MTKITPEQKERAELRESSKITAIVAPIFIIAMMLLLDFIANYSIDIFDVTAGESGRVFGTALLILVESLIAIVYIAMSSDIDEKYEIRVEEKSSFTK